MRGLWSPRRRGNDADASRRRSRTLRLAAACLAAAGLTAVLLTIYDPGDSTSTIPETTTTRQLTTDMPRRIGIGVDATTGPNTYIVQPGDTLSWIAARFRVSEEDLQALNHLADPESVYSGQRLLIPQATK